MMHFWTCLTIISHLAFVVDCAPAALSSPQHLTARENACIARGNCPGDHKPPSSNTQAPPSQPTFLTTAPPDLPVIILPPLPLHPLPSVGPTLPFFPPGSSLPNKFDWAVIGDSWSSGVAYSRETQYDSDNDFCFRTNEAWGAQMEADPSWTVDPQDFHFVACGGAKMNDMLSQLQQTTAPQLVVSNVGGNNAFFGTTVDNCVYQGHPETAYGNPWDNDPNGTGACKQSLATTQGYIDDEILGLAGDLTSMLERLYDSDQAQAHDDFRLYLNSYAHFFNADSDPCDNWSFAPWWRIWKPKLVKGLRQEFNSKLDAFHNVYSNLASSYMLPGNKHLGFIPISDGFEGHRFCEPNHSIEDQWSSEDVWIWNLQYSDPATLNTAEMGPMVTDINGTVYMGQSAGDIEDNYQNFTLFSGPSHGSGSGWSSRPFHPKKVGYTMMKDTIIQKLKDDKVPGVKV